MAMKCCTKLETARERCPIVFQGNPSNFKFTRDKTSPILTQIRRFQTIGRSQLSNPSDLPCSYMCPLLDNYGFQLIISIVYITCEYLLEETFLKPKSSMDFNVNTKFSWGINAPLGKCRSYEVADPKHGPLLFCSWLMTIALVIACELDAVFIANKSYEPLCEYIHLARKCAFVTVVYASVWSGNSVNYKNIGC